MTMTDPISDMLTRIRNGQKARKVSVSMPASNAKEAVARVLKDEGYVTSFSTDGEGATKQLSVELKYFEGLPVIERIERSPERAKAILERQRRALKDERILASVSARERETIDRAHREAERRINAGERQAAARLLGLLAVFLRPIN